jgi:hypothetical protein
MTQDVQEVPKIAGPAAIGPSQDPFPDGFQFSGHLSFPLIGEALVMRDGPGPLGAYKGFALWSVTAICLAALLGAGLAVVQMNSVDGQAITSTGLGTVAGGTVGVLGAVAGVVIGFVVKRLMVALAP